MKGQSRKSWRWVSILAILGLMIFASNPVPAAVTKFDVSKMGDMSDFDPSNPVIPTGDTIKIAVVASFSGPAAQSGEIFYLVATWVAHDINKRGGIFVDGKKKLVQILKADHMSRPDQCKRICEQMVLQEKVHALWGTDGSNMAKIMNETAEKYKIISVNFAALSDQLQNAQNFSPYAFMTVSTTSQYGRALGYFYGQIRKKEKKFYILNQDYMFGHDLADGFKKGLKEYFPGAQIVGEDYHKLFLTDFAPYMTKIKASGAEVIFTGDWNPDAINLLKAARSMGIMIPLAHLFVWDPILLRDVGVANSKGLQQAAIYSSGNPFFKTPEQIKFYTMYHNLWKNKWKHPYNSLVYEHGLDIVPESMTLYWLLSCMERTQSTDPEKIIRIWEGDTFEMVNGHRIKMRACDHTLIQDFYIMEYVPPEQQRQSFNIPPYYWAKDYSYWGPAVKVPAEKVLPEVDPKSERCRGKNPADGWVSN